MKNSLHDTGRGPRGADPAARRRLCRRGGGDHRQRQLSRRQLPRLPAGCRQPERGGADGLLTSQELAAVTALDVSGKSIASLQGIEHFTALVSLDAGNNLLTTLDMSGNPALEGNGFVAANNQLDTLVLPDIPGFQVEAEVFYEQNPRTGYDRVEWYLDPDFTRPVAADGVLEATGQTLYARRYQTVEQTVALTVTESAPADPPESPADDPSDGSAEGSAPAGGSGRPPPTAKRAEPM